MPVSNVLSASRSTLSGSGFVKHAQLPCTHGAPLASSLLLRPDPWGRPAVETYHTCTFVVVVVYIVIHRPT
jgi:hypothetical protein